jgi:hypothetical protein
MAPSLASRAAAFRMTTEVKLGLCFCRSADKNQARASSRIGKHSFFGNKCAADLSE